MRAARSGPESMFLNILPIFWIRQALICARGGRAGRRRSGFQPARAEELFERRIDVLFVVYADADEALLVLQPVFEDREQRAGRAAVARRALLADLAVAEQVAGRDQLVRQPDGLFVVRVVVVAVGEVERVDVPVARVVT